MKNIISLKSQKGGLTNQCIVQDSRFYVGFRKHNRAWYPNMLWCYCTIARTMSFYTMLGILSRFNP